MGLPVRAFILAAFAPSLTMDANPGETWDR
jgi:hypothetical protein